MIRGASCLAITPPSCSVLVLIHDMRAPGIVKINHSIVLIFFVFSSNPAGWTPPLSCKDGFPFRETRLRKEISRPHRTLMVMLWFAEKGNTPVVPLFSPGGLRAPPGLLFHRRGENAFTIRSFPLTDYTRPFPWQSSLPRACQCFIETRFFGTMSGQHGKEPIFLGSMPCFTGDSGYRVFGCML
jgi:hypothetical protein